MILNFVGGSENPSGSSFLLEDEDEKILIDCGRFYGREEKKNFEPFSFSPKEIKSVILTHAHLDHGGLLPRLKKEGFEGKVFATGPTFELLELLFEDSFQISQNLPFSRKNFEEIKKNFVRRSFNRKFKISKNLEAKFLPSGHILGSAIAEIYSKKENLKIIFSGDLGNPANPLLPPPSFPDGGDFIILEATCGKSIFKKEPSPREIFEDVIEEVVKKRGVLLIPSFAVEKAQEIIYELNYLIENRRVPPVKIFLDSALASRAIAIYKKYQNLFKKEASSLIEQGDNIFRFRDFHVIKTERGRKKVLQTLPPKVIIAGSGFSEGGPILLYEKEYLPSKKTTLLFLSYQVKGTRGREIQEGASKIEILGEKVKVNAQIKSIESYSGHPDQEFLFEWVKAIKEKEISQKGESPIGVFLVHGENPSRKALANLIQDQLGIQAILPQDGQKYLLKSQNFEKIK